jgi:glucosyl-dolichyl phosphate glucuronosyltransferase
MISVVICTYNRSKTLAATLSSLAEMKDLQGLQWELIVVDNNSSDATRDVVEGFAKTSGLNVRYSFEPDQGLSRARNRGIQDARGDIIAFTDDDVIVERSWLEGLRSAFHQFDCEAVGGKIIPVWNSGKPHWFPEERGFNLGPAIVQFDLGDTARRINRSFVGANMAFKKAAFAKHGLFRTDLGRVKNDFGVAEETEFCQRLFDAGEVVVYTPHAIVYHPVEAKRARKVYFQTWYFHLGRTDVLLGAIPKNAICYFGVPRYLFRMMAKRVLGWLCSINSQRRFYNKVQAYWLAGMMFECRNLRSAPNKP